jgi:hypothetical protein
MITKALQVVVALVAVVALGLAAFTITRANSLDSQLKDSKSEVAALMEEVATLTEEVSSLNQSMQVVGVALTAYPSENYGPFETGGATGVTIFSMQAQHPMDRFSFEFQVAGDAQVYYWIYAPDNNIVLTGNRGGPANSGSGAFIAATTGYYGIRFESIADGVLMPTITWQFTVHPAAPVTSDPQGVGN